MRRSEVAIEITPGRGAFTFADFAFSDKRMAIYVDGAAFHVGRNLRRDKAIRGKLRAAKLQWRGCEHVMQILGLVREADYQALVSELADGRDLAAHVEANVPDQPGAAPDMSATFATSKA